MAMSQEDVAERTEELCGDALDLREIRDNWPALGDVRLTDRPQPIALHAGPVTLSHRGRDDIERRFRISGPDRPFHAP